MGIIEKQLGGYLKGDFVKENMINNLKIITEPKDEDGDYGKKLVCNVTYDGITEDSPRIWSMNKKSRNELIDKLGKDTEKWIGFTVPVETAPTEKGRAIYVDSVRLKSMEVIA